MGTSRPFSHRRKSRTNQLFNLVNPFIDYLCLLLRYTYVSVHLSSSMHYVFALWFCTLIDDVQKLKYLYVKDAVAVSIV